MTATLRESVNEEVWKWWDRLQNDRGERGARAELRRAHDITDVCMCAGFQRLYRRLRAAGWRTDGDADAEDRLAAAVGLLAHVVEDAHASFPDVASRRASKADSVAVSELRFRRLLDAPDADALFSGLRRSLPLVGGKVGVVELLRDVAEWGDAVKKRWAYDYRWPEHTP